MDSVQRCSAAQARSRPSAVGTLAKWRAPFRNPVAAHAVPQKFPDWPAGSDAPIGCAARMRVCQRKRARHTRAMWKPGQPKPKPAGSAAVSADAAPATATAAKPGGLQMSDSLRKMKVRMAATPVAAGPASLTCWRGSSWCGRRMRCCSDSCSSCRSKSCERPSGRTAARNLHCNSVQGACVRLRARARALARRCPDALITCCMQLCGAAARFRHLSGCLQPRAAIVWQVQPGAAGALMAAPQTAHCCCPTRTCARGQDYLESLRKEKAGIPLGAMEVEEEDGEADETAAKASSIVARCAHRPAVQPPRRAAAVLSCEFGAAVA